MKPFEQQNYYELLEVPVSAPAEEIRAAYSRLMELYAPDSIAVYALVDPDQVDSLRARMTEAMKILTDAQLRAEYDRDLGVPGHAERKAAGAVARAAEALASAVEAVPARVEPEQGRAVEPVASPAVEPEPAPLGRARFRTSVFRGVSFTYVTSSLQDSGVVGSAVDVPVPVGRTETAQAPASANVPAQVSAAPVDAGAASSGGAIHVPELAAGVPAQADAPVSSSAASASAPVQAAASPADASASSSAAPVRTPEQVTASPAGASASSSAASASVPVQDSASPADTSVRSSAAPVSAPAQASAPPLEASAHSSAASAQASASSGEGPGSSAASASLPAQGAASPAEAATPAATASAPAPSQGAPEPAAPTRSVPPPLPAQRTGTSRAATPESPGTAPRPSSGKHLADAQVIAQESAIATAESALAQVAARVREPLPPPPQAPPRPRVPDIPADAEFNGELLRRVREARGQSLQQVADRTRISSRHLENVEADRYNALPAPVYLRGILMNLARELGLDPLRVSRSYLALASQKAGGK